MFRWIAPLMLTGCLVPEAMVEHYLDQDADGERPLVVGGTDCDDNDLHVGSHAPEVCGNAIDDNCDGQIDESGIGALTFYVDGDADGYGDPNQPVQACTRQQGTVNIAGDCNDNNQFDNPEAIEDCTDQRDNDCDHIIDEADAPPKWYPDVDHDGFGDRWSASTESCSPVAGYVTDNTDCDDHAATSWPGAPEIPYDGIDNACDGGDDFDLDGDGRDVDPDFAPYTITSVAYLQHPFGSLDCDDLDPAIHPDAPDTPYDGIDGNCGGEDDNDADLDGYDDSEHGGQDCDDTNPRIHPGVDEVPYDGVDDDCDPADDDDVDGDGHDDPSRGGDDCNDHDDRVWDKCATCADSDLDGRFWGCNAYGPEGEDCNDLNSNVWVSCATCGDHDGDGRYAGCDDYYRISKDCDDANPDVWVVCDTCVDADGDGVRGLCDVTAGVPIDCNDAIANTWHTCATCTDVDGDGVGVGQCDGPQDCDDLDPNSTTSCGDCVDADGDFAFTGCDRYDTVVHDCDDADPTRGETVHEIAGDGIDQDCDGEDLTVDEAHGVFVSTAGVDDLFCGTRAYPCATLAQGSQQALADHRVVFVSTGVFGSARIYSSLYGSFDPSTWTRAASGRTIVESAAPTPFEVVADRFTMDGVDVRAPSNWAGGLLARIEAPQVAVVDSTIHGQSLTGECSGLLLRASVSTLDHLDISVTCRDSVVGLNTDTFDSRHTLTTLHVANTTVTATSTKAGDARGLLANVGTFQAEHLTVDTSGVNNCTAVDLEPTPDLATRIDITDARLACDLPGTTGESYGLTAKNFDSFRMVRTITTANGGARAGGMVLPNVTTAEVASSVMMADGSLDAVGLWLEPTGQYPMLVNVVQDTIIATGGAFGIGVDSGAHATINFTNTAIKSSHVGLQTSAVNNLNSVIFDTTCALGDRVTCEASTTTEIGSCTWFNCGSVSRSTAQPLGLELASVSPWTPSSSSPVIDAGTNVAFELDANRDVYGSPRPAGTANDIGAVEVQ